MDISNGGQLQHPLLKRTNIKLVKLIGERFQTQRTKDEKQQEVKFLTGHRKRRYSPVEQSIVIGYREYVIRRRIQGNSMRKQLLFVKVQL